MKNIVVNAVNIDKNKINVDYSVGSELKKYFNSDEDFFVKYEEDMSSVPKAIAVIPFIANVLPIIWLTDSVLEVNELDETFYKSIPEFKQGYIDMYPNVEFKGKIKVKNIINCDYKKEDRCTTFFSGGLDSYSTLINHLDEKPDLVALWGSDITFEDKIGWERVKNNITNVSKKYNLKPVFIKSSFRRFISEGNLDKDFSKILNDGWWHGVQHGIGLIGHIAPYAWKYKLKTQYIASSRYIGDGKVTCASYPTIDNKIKFASCNVIHDQFKLSRQDKAKFIIEYCKNSKDKVNLRVCWESKGGENCCHCEKCYRTISAILVEGENPKNYGFAIDKNVLNSMSNYLRIYHKYSEMNAKSWKQIQNRALKNKNLIKSKPYYKEIKWILTFNFDNYDKSLPRRRQRAKEVIYRYTKGRIKVNIENIKYALSVIKPFSKKKIYVINTPLHTNIGDSAIAYAQNIFLQKNIGDDYKIVEVTSGEWARFRKVLGCIVRKKDIIMQHGGGNMGITWFNEEIERRRIIEQFPNNKMIIFPQTIYYGDSEEGKKEFENSKKIYNNHKDLHLIAREKVSYEIMKEAYQNCDVILTPDIVLSMDKLNNPYKREGITFCFRRDAEKVLTPEDEKYIINECKKISDKVFYTDMISERAVTKENRVDIIMEKFKDFQKSELVITDRLHGMVFCAISGTPCIVFGNYNQKVKGTYEWIKDLPYVKYVDNVSDVKVCLDELMKIKDSNFDNTKFISKYNSISKVI